MKSRIFMLLLTALCALPTLVMADVASLKADMETCAKMQEERSMKDCLRKIVQDMDSDQGKGISRKFREQWVLNKVPRVTDDKANKVEVAEAEKETREAALSPAPDCLHSLCSYRPSYIIFRSSSSSNLWPSSAAPGHTVTAPIANLANEMKFQISFKSLLFALPEDAYRWQVWGAYTQQSHWQLFNPPASRPFRETNYEPEVYVNRVWEKGMPGHDWKLRMLGVGFVHQSNGQSNPLSRSWNRTYVQGGFVWQDWTLLAKVWKRWHETAAEDDNPGIENYLGRGEATLSWAPDGEKKSGGKILSLRLRHSLNPAASHGSAQLEWSIPVKDSKARVFLQAFRGYGESMLDYNHLQNTLGVGFGFVNW